jgi:hypothetical protein
MKKRDRGQGTRDREKILRNVDETVKQFCKVRFSHLLEVLTGRDVFWTWLRTLSGCAPGQATLSERFFAKWSARGANCLSPEGEFLRPQRNER